MKKIFLLVILAVSTLSIYSQNFEYLKVKPKTGDGILNLLYRYYLPTDQATINLFYDINKNKFDKNNNLLKGFKYNLPVAIYKFNKKNIRSSIGISDYNLAKEIEIYNKKLIENGLIHKSYKKSKKIYVPLYLLNYSKESAPISKKEVKKESKEEKNNIYPIFGKKYEKVNIIDSSLYGCVYYLISGHGGPDPGAIGHHKGKELCEDEYAYDVTLRLARNLMQMAATVYIIVQDENDGIRDERYLNNSSNEKLINGHEISNLQTPRLKQRTDIINELCEKNKETAKIQQVVEIHIDSRSNSKRIDIFFYHAANSSDGYSLAKTLHQTIKKKYQKAQPGRQYHGTVSERNLFTLREAKPVCCYIELGNIRNPQDQIRFLEVNNRQAIANWLSAGLLEYFQNEATP